MVSPITRSSQRERDQASRHQSLDQIDVELTLAPGRKTRDQSRLLWLVILFEGRCPRLRFRLYPCLREGRVCLERLQSVAVSVQGSVGHRCTRPHQITYRLQLEEKACLNEPRPRICGVDEWMRGQNGRLVRAAAILFLEN